ncbi:MAG: molybdopterin-dependent oxidoreductase [Myxococcales bacterium]|nr:molybdopterin-dependent oxidoreductase [Myxococcales bacterium]
MAESRVTFCRICEAACGLVAEVEGDRLVRLRPDPEHVSSRGYACVKGVRYAELHDSPDRLRAPLRRDDDTRAPLPWATAYAEIGAKLRSLRATHGPDSVALFIGNPSAFSLPHSLALYGLARGLKTRNIYSSGSQDCNNKFLVSWRMYGSPAIQPVPDLARTGCLIALGTNPAVSHASFLHLPRPIAALREIEARGGAVWLVNPRRTETARALGKHVFIRPGTDVFLVLGLLHALIARGGVDDEALARHTRGFAAVAALAGAYPPARVEALTGVPAATVQAMADDHLAATRDGRGAALYCSTGVNQGGHGTLAYWLINVINAATGNLDRAGGVVVPRGIVDLPRIMRRIGLGIRRDRSSTGDFPAIMDTFPAAILPTEIERGAIRALIVSAGNPLLSCPDERGMRAALAKLELLVCVDLFRNETGNLAHYLLPARSFLERPDVPLSCHGFSPEPYVQYTDPVVPSALPGEWAIFDQLARAAGARLFGTRATAAIRLAQKAGMDSDAAVLSAVLAAGGLTRGRLRRRPHGLERPYTPGDFLGRRVMTPDRKVDLAPAEFTEAAGRELAAAIAEEEAAVGRLRLISRRERHGHNSWMHNAPSLVRDDKDTNHLDMHPDDAAARGLVDGARARVSSAVGEVELPVRITDALMPGTVAAPHGWGHAEADGLQVAQRTRGVNVNRLAPAGLGDLEPLTGMARLNGVLVDVEPSS